jgi:hypothetical protein
MKGILAICQSFQVGESFTLWKIPSSENGETHVSFGTVESVLDVGVSCTLLPNENWVNFWKQHCLILRVFKWEKHSLCSK